jgi:hypothetical protein
MEKIPMEKVTVYSPLQDKSIKTNINESPIWAKGKAYTEEEYMENPKRYPFWFKYSFFFKGLEPVQVTNVQKLAN